MGTATRPQGSKPAQALAQALGESAPLAAVLARLRESQHRWALVAPRLPPELAALARPGPVDDTLWKILAEHAAAAAKLRQMVPLMEEILEREGLGRVAIRIKVAPRGLQGPR